MSTCRSQALWGRCVSRLFTIILFSLACSIQGGRVTTTACLDLPDGRIEVTVKQRSATRVAGSGGRLILSVGDVTGGRVDTTLSAPPLARPVPTSSMAVGDAIAFRYGDGDFVLTLLRLDNALVGDDFATFEIAQRAAAAVRPRASLTEEQKIAELLKAIESLHDATFVRNGTPYSAADAAAHMRTKLKYAGNRVQTAEQFIEQLAARSSQSGELYLIRYSDGREVPSAEFLREVLRALDRANTRQ